MKVLPDFPEELNSPQNRMIHSRIGEAVLLDTGTTLFGIITEDGRANPKLAFYSQELRVLIDIKNEQIESFFTYPVQIWPQPPIKKGYWILIWTNRRSIRLRQDQSMLSRSKNSN